MIALLLLDTIATMAVRHPSPTVELSISLEALRLANDKEEDITPTLKIEELHFDKTSSSVKKDPHWRTHIESSNINPIPICESDILVEHNNEHDGVHCHDNTSSVNISEPLETCCMLTHYESHDTCNYPNEVTGTACDYPNGVTSTTCDYPNVTDFQVPNPTNYHQTCRQQAIAYDDITVDDLAGYLDELLYLPRPMSDMAELMYT